MSRPKPEESQKVDTPNLLHRAETSLAVAEEVLEVEEADQDVGLVLHPWEGQDQDHHQLAEGKLRTPTSPEALASTIRGREKDESASSLQVWLPIPIPTPTSPNLLYSPSQTPSSTST